MNKEINQKELRYIFSELNRCEKCAECNFYRYSGSTIYCFTSLCGTLTIKERFIIYLNEYYR